MSVVYDIASRYVEQVAALDPIAATRMGVSGHDEEMTDYSPAAHAVLDELDSRTRRDLEEAPQEGERDRVAREAMLERLALRLERSKAGEHFRDINILFSPIQAIRSVFDLMAKETEEDWRAIAGRLALVQRGLASYRETLEEGLRRGLAGTQRQTAECAKQAEVWSGASAGTPSFFASLLAEFDGSQAASAGLRSDLEDGVAAAGEAYAALAGYLRDEYLPRATERDAAGPERYQLNSRVFNGIGLDLEETYAWGWEELSRVEREMAETAERILPGASVEEVKRFLETDPSRSIEGVETFRRWMQELQDRTIAELDGLHFDIPEPVKRIEAMIAPPGGALAMYYTSPSEDFSRPGRTWYPTGGKTRFPLWGEVSIAYHEGVPGHHLERANVRYLAEQLSRYQRLMGGTSGYVEGWALYAERLMAELGYLENPEYYLGMLRAQALRSVRVIVDIGMHLELEIPQGERFHPGERWTPELGLAFVLERSHFPSDFMASEVTRYLGMPGQAISYKVGERTWLEAREAAKRRAGPSFDLKQFHARAFDLGPMGLEQMRRELAA